tara:strand:+ start:289 stop:891 length:603 start_codon:yes stop_codon:yes gene_type:complete
MNDPYFIYFLDLVFLTLILISFITINFQLKNNDKIKNIKEIQSCLYNFLVCIFLLFFFITFLIFGSKYGIKKAFIIWCILNLITPIPETALMIALPLNYFANINLIISQIFIVIISIVYIFLSYSKTYYNSFLLGKHFTKIIKNNKLLLIFSILSSFIGMIILQKELDYYYKNEKFDNFYLLFTTYLLVIALFFKNLHKK